MTALKGGMASCWMLRFLSKIEIEDLVGSTKNVAKHWRACFRVMKRLILPFIDEYQQAAAPFCS